MNQTINTIQTPGSSQGMILPFQGLRAIAFLGIFIYHCGNGNLGQLSSWAVSFFFMISGYLSGYTWSNGSKPACTCKNSISYMIHRIKKLFLLNFITLLICVPVSDAFLSIQTEGLSKLPFWSVIFVMNATLTKSLYPKYYFGFNGVNWFLSSYAVLCLLTPALLHFLSRFSTKKKKCVLTILLVTILSFSYCFFLGKNSLDLEYWAYIFPLARIFEYAVGILIGMGHDLLPKPGCTFMTILQSGSVVLIAGLIWFAMPDWLSRSAVWILPNALLLFSFHVNEGFFFKLTGNRLMVFLGAQSANMFLIHQIVYRYFESFFPYQSMNKVLTLFFIYLVVLACSVGYQYLYRKGKALRY